MLHPLVCPESPLHTHTHSMPGLTTHPGPHPSSYNTSIHLLPPVTPELHPSAHTPSPHTRFPRPLSPCLSLGKPTHTLSSAKALPERLLRVTAAPLRNASEVRNVLTYPCVSLGLLAQMVLTLAASANANTRNTQKHPHPPTRHASRLSSLPSHTYPTQPVRNRAPFPRSPGCHNLPTGLSPYSLTPPPPSPP